MIVHMKDGVVLNEVNMLLVNVLSWGLKIGLEEGITLSEAKLFLADVLRVRDLETQQTLCETGSELCRDILKACVGADLWFQWLVTAGDDVPTWRIWEMKSISLRYVMQKRVRRLMLWYFFVSR